MGNNRSKSASRARPNEKQKFLFGRNDDLKNEITFYSPKPHPKSNLINTKETFTTIPQNETLSQTTYTNTNLKNLNPSSLREINESIKNCSFISEMCFLTKTNLFFLQYSSLVYNPENLNNKKETKFYLDFPLLVEKSNELQFLVKTPKNSKRRKENAAILLDKSNAETNSEIKKNHSSNPPGSFVKDCTPKMHNTRDLSSPKEDGSTPHFDKKFIFIKKNNL